MKLKTFKILIIVILLFLTFLVLNKFFYQTFKNTFFLISSPVQKFLWQKQNVFSQTLNLKKGGMQSRYSREFESARKRALKALRDMEKFSKIGV